MNAISLQEQKFSSRTKALQRTLARQITPTPLSIQRKIIPTPHPNPYHNPVSKIPIRITSYERCWNTQLYFLSCNNNTGTQTELRITFNDSFKEVAQNFELSLRVPTVDTRMIIVARFVHVALVYLTNPHKNEMAYVVIRGFKNPNRLVKCELSHHKRDDVLAIY